ncbi:sigma-70 family RNA polymerase sigma factor [Nannocystis bainbridge]|uniref:Sigma-70 family RNA polymerase sigma factor n=1 Tax=Nannocystis bainbridge TaxID=2995303 RepID=A0ABT5DYZ6_9BACT|nr:sigma-70 family RNA polymerase sigma factor [Nannocystis bainbridge]MDC0718840.1 sigma-70 family RNA polymerase sigma factor [Nannocystis bainbridge]
MPLSLEAPPDFAAVYRAHHGFVWRTIRSLGVDPARIDDAVQDAFLVVYRRLPEFAGRATLRTWLFEIARRIASSYRRSAAREQPRRCSLDEAERVTPAAEAPVEQAEAAAILQGFLGGLDRDQAVVFVMTELEQWQAPEIAAELGVNLNTVYSRLRAARRELDRMVRRLDARDRRHRPRHGSQVLAALVVVGPPEAPPWQLTAARDGHVVSDMLSRTWSIDHVAAPTTLAGGGPIVPVVAAGSSPIVGLSLAGVGLAAVLAFGRAAPPEPPVTSAHASLQTPARADGPALKAPTPSTLEALLAATSSARTDDPSPTSELAPASAPHALAAATPADEPSPSVKLAPTSDLHALAAATPADGPSLAAVPARAASTSEPHALIAAAPPAEGPSLAAELALVESLRAALLAADDRAALDLAARHQQRFPTGVFVQEAAAAAVEARCRLGEADRARREAAAFVARWPGSALAARVSALCRS